MFLPVIERELTEYMHHWNSHLIRSSKCGNCLGGIPNDLFSMPSFYGEKMCIESWFLSIITTLGTHNYACAVEPSIWTYAYSEESKSPPKCYTLEFYRFCSTLCRDVLNIDLHRDVTTLNCFYVYVFLINNV